MPWFAYAFHKRVCDGCASAIVSGEFEQALLEQQRQSQLIQQQQEQEQIQEEIQPVQAFAYVVTSIDEELPTYAEAQIRDPIAWASAPIESIDDSKPAFARRET